MKEQSSKVYRLHLELDTVFADMEILKKYGKVKSGISRDVLVPADMTLHALHFVIQRAFGWQNAHLHHFELPNELFVSMTQNNFKKWVDHCGIYFRFPSDDMEDLYWDDDYNGRVTVRTWFRKKYTGPYEYHGTSEHFMEARYKAADFMKQNKVMQVSPSFEQWMNMTAEEKRTPIIKRIDEVTCREIDRYFEGCGTKELLERLTLAEIMAENDVSPVSENFLQEAQARYKADLRMFLRLRCAMLNGDDRVYWQEMTRINGQAQPITKELCYQYDYGDGWEVNIQLTDVYACDTVAVIDEDGRDGLTLCYQNGEPVADEVLSEQLRAVVKSYRPLCVAADGLPVLDDVGGVCGYTELLKALRGIENACFDNAENADDWAYSMGWTGRMNKPDKLL